MNTKWSWPIILWIFCGPCFASSTDNNNPHGINYQNQIKQVLDARCVVCHGCYDAPCQLKLSSPEGILRGANKEKVYNGTRLIADPPSRLFVDANSIEEWRDRGFHSVLQTEQNSPSSSSQSDSDLLSKLLLLKQANPLTKKVADNQPLPEGLFEFDLNKEQQCPTASEFNDYSKKYSFSGMPYALPGLPNKELNLLTQWLGQGAPMGKSKPLPKAYQSKISRWESFFNGPSKKQQLATRYIYEHLFLAHLYFDDIGSAEYFKLVRSTTPPGQPINIIATRRPFDDPMQDPRLQNSEQKVKQIYYRLQRVKSSIVAKNHMPYALNNSRLERFKQWFLEPNYEIAQLPGYQIEQASNPFATFVDLPAKSRYEFMLDHAQFTIRGFMKGAVCRGQVALNVINDHFWVIFVEPEHSVSKQTYANLPKQIDYLDLPAERDSTAGLLGYWTEYADSQKKYLQTKSQSLNAIAKQTRPSLDWIWQGDGYNQNAALTVFRHFDSSSVVKGLVGEKAQTVWLIDYPILERIHYLLVAGFDVYGNAGHQLSTRLYMDFLRMESEFNYLALLPKDTRKKLRDRWYRKADESVKDYVYGDHAYLNATSGIQYPEGELAELVLNKKIKQHLSKVLAKQHDIQHHSKKTKHLSLSQSFQPLLEISGQAATLMPETNHLMLLEGEQPIGLYTVLRNSAHANVTSPFDESANRLPKEDYLSVMPGIVGAYPDALWRVEVKQLDVFIQQVRQLNSEKEYSVLMETFGVRRSHAEFWQNSDELHKLYQQLAPIEYGLLDYNRLENR